jgi:intracellular sulfur oxidation DsrE/DsrF family protein
MTVDDNAATTRRRVLGGIGIGAAVAAGLPSASLALGAPPDDEQMKVVIHVGEPGGWAPALSNLDNMTRLHPDGAYRLVVDGTAVYVLSGPSDLTPRLEALSKAGVTMLVCPNALHEHGIEPSQMPAFVDTSVPGVVALVQANRDGLVYVKP